MKKHARNNFGIIFKILIILSWLSSWLSIVVQELKWSLHISISNAELIIYTGNRLSKNLYNIFRRESGSLLSSPLKQTLGSSNLKDITSTEVSKYIIYEDNKLKFNLPDINEV